MTLENFPRGGKKLSEKPPELNLFSKPSKPKKRLKEKKKHEELPEEETNIISTTAERLSKSTLCEGMTVLGCVHKATDCELTVSLPGTMQGQVKVIDISETYTNLLQTVLKSEKDEPNDFRALPEIYQPGDEVVCFIKHIEGNEKQDIVLSMNPKLINQNMAVNYLVKGLRLVCMVTSIEDHGYLVDTGIPNVRAIIPTNGLDTKTSYYPGKQLLCSVKEVTTTEGSATLKLYSSEKHTKATCTIEIPALDALVPGTKLPLQVDKILSNGLRVKFCETQYGFINKLYVNRPLTAFSRGMEIPGILLYIIPTVKYGYFTLHTDKLKEPSLNSGDIVEQSTYLFRESNGLILDLPGDNFRGFVSLRRTGIDFGRINSIEVGSKHRLRILSFNWIERLYMCSMQKHLLEQRYFTLTDLQPGDITTVKIKSINTESNFVNVYVDKIRGFVAPEHVCDSGLSLLKKLKPEMEVKAKVLGINQERQRVVFTLKESIIKSTLPILRDISEAKIGKKYQGTIVQINKNGLLIRFFEDAKGFVPHTTLDKRTKSVNWNYSVGQTVIVKVDKVDTSLGKMMLRIVQDEEVEQPKDSTEDSTGEIFKVGELVEGTVTESSTEGVHIRISKSRGSITRTAFLPAGHMSPSLEVGTLLASRSIPGDTMSALIFSTSPILTLTRTFLPHEENQDFDTLKIGANLPCSIKDITSDGLRLILPLKNYSRLGYVRYNHVSNFSSLEEGQILFTKVVTLNRKDKDIGLTMLLKKIFEDVTDHKVKMMTAVDLLRLHFNKLAELANSSYYKTRPISSLSLGQRVSGEIEKITANGLIVKLSNGLQAIVRKNNYLGTPEVGDKVTGTVLWINYVHEIVDLTLVPVLMNGINPKQKELQELPIGVVLRAEIVMVTNWFILILIKGHGKGCLAALPARRHANDLQPDLRPYVVKSRIRCYAVLNKSETDFLPVCMLKSAFEMSRLSVNSEVSEEKGAKRKSETGEAEVQSKKQKKEQKEQKTEQKEQRKAQKEQKKEQKEEKKEQKEQKKAQKEQKKEQKDEKKEQKEEKKAQKDEKKEQKDEKKAHKKGKSLESDKLSVSADEDEDEDEDEGEARNLEGLESESEEELEEEIEDKRKKVEKRRKACKKSEQSEETSTEPMKKKKRRNNSDSEEVESVKKSILKEGTCKKSKTVKEETVKTQEGVPKKTPKEKKSEKKAQSSSGKEILEKEATEGSTSVENLEKKPRVPSVGFCWDSKPEEAGKPEESSDSEEETTEEPKQKKKKLNATERRELERQKEREIREREETLAKNQLPNSVDQFDRLVLASPDSSLIWLQYMAYHLQATEIEKARAVARRAIKSISFREENEKLNVWNAWLNLESKFGTPESLNDVFQEAVRTNDAQKVYTHMLTVYVESGRQAELEKTVNAIIGKFKQDPQIWIECGTAFLKFGLKEKSRHVMQRALQSLPNSEHVNLMVRFANLENKFGDKERSQTLFEQILSSYPKRVDIWSAYVDSLIKSGDIEIARKVLERAVVQTLPPRKMKTLFKKFITFEEQHGTPEAVEKVQEMAAEYVEKQCQKFSD